MATATHPFAGTYALDPVHSTFQFAVRHANVSIFRASFGDVDARLASDGARFELEARARVASISIVEPPEFRDHVVNGADFFAADTYPEIGFRSTLVELADDGTATVTGDLTIRGVTHAVTATGMHQPPREDPFGGLRAGLELRATIDRRNWGMTWQLPLPDGSDALGWDVEVTAQLELIRTA